MRIPRYAVCVCVSLCATLPAQESRLSNVSVRTAAGGADTLITGFTIGPGPNKQVLVRAVGPTLGAFGVGGTLADPKLELYNSSGVKIGENDNFNAADAPTFAAVGAFALTAGAKDAALVTTLAPGSYTAQVTGIGGASGVALVEVYEVAGGATRLINLSTRAQVGTGSNILIPGITITPGSGTRRLLLRAVGPTLAGFGVPGTLVDPRLELYSGTTKVAENDNWGTPVGSGAADAATLSATFAQNGAFALTAGSKDAALLVNLGSGSYTLQVSGVGGTTGVALVEVYDLTQENQTGAKPNAALYVATLRPDAAAAGSTASGIASIRINDDGTASVDVSFSNLSSEETSAHLKIIPAGDFVLNLPRGQVRAVTWTFGLTGTSTTNDLITALNSGNISISIDSAKYPSGEITGAFIAGKGAQAFTPPAAPPTVPTELLQKPSRFDAARLLTQATFGPTLADIDAVATSGLPAWIDNQMKIAPTLHLAALRSDVSSFPNPPAPATIVFKYIGNYNQLAAEWKVMVTAPDQLRQRVAFALSEIFVVSDANAVIGDIREAQGAFYDILVKGAFGNFRDLLESVTLSPAMGAMLTYAGNRKADLSKGTSPDENYAREVMQLFTIGLVQLQPDGSLVLDENGLPIPTYDQSAVSELAKVFTGWTYAGTSLSAYGTAPAFDSSKSVPDSSGFIAPMQYVDSFHDKSAKAIVGLQQIAPDRAGRTLSPANQSGDQDLKVALDTLFNHPNTPPFVCRQLIQRLVTSNPSPGYIYRVAGAFIDDGTGRRGNLAAVVRAILTDFEARSNEVLANVGYGKIKEPIIRATSFFRAMGAKAPNERFMDDYFGDSRNTGDRYYPFLPLATIGGQFPLRSPTVFNFFFPDHVEPGAVANAGLVAPEMQIIDETTLIQTNNALANFLYRDSPPVVTNIPSPSPFISLDFSVFMPLARNIEALVDQANLLFCAGQMSSTTRSRIISAVQTLSSSATDLERVRTAIHLTIMSPDGSLQK